MKVDPMNWKTPGLADKLTGPALKREATMAEVQANAKRTKASKANRRRTNFWLDLRSPFSVTT